MLDCSISSAWCSIVLAVILDHNLPYTHSMDLLHCDPSIHRLMPSDNQTFHLIHDILACVILSQCCNAVLSQWISADFFGVNLALECGKSDTCVNVRWSSSELDEWSFCSHFGLCHSVAFEAQVDLKLVHLACWGFSLRHFWTSPTPYISLDLISLTSSSCAHSLLQNCFFSLSFFIPASFSLVHLLLCWWDNSLLLSFPIT